MQENPCGCDFFTSHLVTTHTRSQKLLHKIKPPFIPLFLFPNMVPRPDFIGINKDSEGRESLLWSFSMLQPFRQDILYAPEPRHAMLRQLLDNTGFGNRVTLKEAFLEPKLSVSRLNMEQNDHQGFGIIRLEKIGRDWFVALTKQIITFIGAGLESVSVNIPTKNPLPPDMETNLRSVGLLFSGIHMTALDSLDLAYCMTTKPVDFESIQVHDTIARKLIENMKAEYTELRLA